MELKHSPLPWVFNPMDKYGKYPEYSCNVIVDSNNDAIMGDECYYPWVPDKDTMQFIVQACNSYYETKQLLSQANRREELLRAACLSAAKLIPPLQSISDEMADQKNLVLVQLHKALSGEPS